MNQFILDLLAFGAILSGILVITANNPVVSVLFLITVFVNVAGYLVVLGVGFIGITYLIVYVGAIAILFLFVIMMLNLQLSELGSVGSEYTQNLPLGGILGALFLFELISILPNTFKEAGTFNLSSMLSNAIDSLIENTINAFHWIGGGWLSANASQNVTGIQNGVSLAFNPVTADTQLTSYIQVQSIGQMLYLTGAIWLIIASLVLLLAMVGPIVLSMNKQTPTQ